MSILYEATAYLTQIALYLGNTIPFGKTGYRILELPANSNDFFMGPSRHNIPRQLQLLKARINSGDHQKSVEAMKLDGISRINLTVLDPVT